MRRIFLYWLLSTLFGAWSCRKDVDTFRVHGSSIADIEHLVARAPAGATVTQFTFSGPLADTVLSTAGGVRVHLTDTDHLFMDAQGNPVPVSACGLLEIEIIEALRNGDILGRGLSSSTLTGELLESGGMVRVQVRCSGQILRLAFDRNLKIQLATAQDDLKTDMFVYNGVLDGAQALAGWENSGEEVYFANWTTPQGGKMGYELIVTTLGWVNCARPIDEQATSFCVTLPLGFTPDNTAVYVVFSNQHVVAKPAYDPANEEFCLSQAPIGYPVKVVTISKTGAQYWLAQKNTEIGSNAVVEVGPTETTEAALLAFLASL